MASSEPSNTATDHTVVTEPVFLYRRNPRRACRSQPLLTEQQKQAILNDSDSSDDESFHSDDEDDDEDDEDDDDEDEVDEANANNADTAS